RSSAVQLPAMPAAALLGGRTRRTRPSRRTPTPSRTFEPFASIPRGRAGVAQRALDDVVLDAHCFDARGERFFAGRLGLDCFARLRELVALFLEREPAHLEQM